MSNNVESYGLEEDRVQRVPIRELKPFERHPFKVVDDESMLRTTESIAQFGVLTPLLVRPLDDGSLEIISGHRRVHAALAAGLTEVPVIVRNMTDDEAVVLMVDSNLQRENILPSERAFAYKMKLEAIGRQGERNRDLKAIVESYKTRAPQEKAAEHRESARDKLDALAKETAAKVSIDKPKAKTKAKKGPEL